MSQQDLWIVLGRAQTDLSFSGQLAADFSSAIASSGYQLTDDEIAAAKRILDRKTANYATIPTAPETAGTALSPELIRHREKLMIEQMDRSAALTDYLVNTIKQTFTHARLTYMTINWMNWIMFSVGICLFVLAAVYGVVSDKKSYALLFCGMGAASFVAQFLISPINKTQKALSNMMQAEICMINFFDQATFWESFANIPQILPNGATMANPANVDQASAMLQQRSRETIELLQLYVEDELQPKREWTRAARTTPPKEMHR